jgi:hypothetical protein
VRRCPLYCKQSKGGLQKKFGRRTFYEGTLTGIILKRLLGQNPLQMATGQGKSLELVGIQDFLVAGAGFEPTTFGL